MFLFGLRTEIMWRSLDWKEYVLIVQVDSAGYEGPKAGMIISSLEQFSEFLAESHVL